MSLNLTLQTQAAPAGTQFPGTFQGLLSLVKQYMTVSGGADFDGVNFGSATPAPEDQDKPWFKTDASGNPVGWYSWNGSTWWRIPAITPNGITADRPAAPSVGQHYFDTTINVELVWERGAWRTVSGSPGDVKFATGANIAAALVQNPGWVEYTDAAGRVIGATGTGAGLTARTYGDTVGTEDHTLTTAEIPAHSHAYAFARANADGNDYNTDQGLLGGGAPGAGGSQSIGPSTGGDGAHNNMQPTLFLFCLVKQ